MPTIAAFAQQLTERQRPLVPTLTDLLDNAQATAQAIDDNAWDEGVPLNAEQADELLRRCDAIKAAIDNARCAHNVNNWSLPSMTGKEFV